MNRVEAYKTLMRIIRAKKGKVNVPVICLSIFYWTGSYEAALKYIKVSKNLNTIEFLCWRGVINYFLKDYKSAQNFFENAKKLDKTVPETNYFLAETYFSMSEIEKAEVFYRCLISDPLFAVIGLHGTGCCLVEMKRYDEAISFFNKAIPIAKSKYIISSLNKKGLCLINQQQIEEAVVCLDECLKLSPNSLSVKQNLALALSKAGNYERAVSLYRDVLSKCQYDIITINNLALCTASLGNYHEALELCERGLLIDPLNADLLINKGYCLYKLNEFKKALNCIIEAEKLARDDYILQNNKALCLSALEEYEAALQIFDKLLLQFKSDDLYYNRAFCLLKIGLYTEALDSLEKMEHKGDKKSAIYTIQSVCYEKLGDNDKAVELINKALTA
jgi:tetratricopeptide (TPR) repeat protein